jgi:hypothetical protein
MALRITKIYTIDVVYFINLLNNDEEIIVD